MKIFPNLSFEGKSEEAMNFYAKATGGKIIQMMHFKDIPQDAYVLPAMREEANLKLVVNSILDINGCCIMASDRIPGNPPVVSNQVNINITVDSKEQADTIFNNLSEGGIVTMPQMEMFWAESFGSLQDKFGVSWLICYFGKYANY